MTGAEERERNHTLRPWAVQGTMPYEEIVGAEGCWFWNRDGKKYLDFSSQWVNTNIGHQHPKVVEAIRTQAGKLCYIAPSFGHELRGKLGRLIIDHTPGDLHKVFFTVGGGESNDTAINLARQVTGRHKILARYRSYHGSTLGGLSITGDPRRHPAEPLLPGIVRIFDPYCYRCSFGQSYPGCGLECAEHIREIILYENPATVAAVFIEPVTGTNGVFVPPPEYLPRVREICDEYDVLLVADEVMSGWGRTGEWFGVDNWKVVPDMMTMAKGLTQACVPLGAVVVNEKTAKHYEHEMFCYGLTASGHPLACAAAIATIEVYEEEKLVERSAQMGKKMKHRLKEIAAKHPAVGEVRSLGLFGAIELVKSRKTKEPLAPWNGPDPGIMALLNRNLRQLGIYLYLRWNYMIIAPPLSITDAELKEGLDGIDESLELADRLAF